MIQQVTRIERSGTSTFLHHADGTYTVTDTPTPPRARGGYRHHARDHRRNLKDFREWNTVRSFNPHLSPHVAFMVPGCALCLDRFAGPPLENGHWS